MNISRTQLTDAPQGKTIEIYTHGDADGIAAGVIRAKELSTREHPPGATLHAIAGGKYDMNLADHLEQLTADNIYFQDVPLDKNIQSLADLVQNSNAQIHYVDHHRHDAHEALEKLERRPNFTSNINTSKDTSAAHLVSQEYDGAQADWALVGLFGDRITNTANTIAKQLQLHEYDVETIEEAAQAVNYNSFSLTQRPVDLLKLGGSLPSARRWAKTRRIRDLVTERADGLATLRNQAQTAAQTSNYHAHVLPDTDAARGLFAEYAYEVIDAQPDKWHAVIVPKHASEQAETGKRYDISLRGPHSVGQLAKQLGGGGRETAGGAGVKYGVDDIVKRLGQSDIYNQ